MTPVPVRPGISTSRNATFGCYSRIWATASDPSLAVETTSASRRFSIGAAMRSRARGSSSATRTRRVGKSGRDMERRGPQGPGFLHARTLRGPNLGEAGMRVATSGFGKNHELHTCDATGTFGRKASGTKISSVVMRDRQPLGARKDPFLSDSWPAFYNQTSVGRPPSKPLLLLPSKSKVAFVSLVFVATEETT